MRPQATTPWGGGRNPGTRPLALVLAGGVLLVVVGAALVAGTGVDPLGRVVGLSLLLLGVGGAATAVLERRWDATRPGPRLSTDPTTGAPSTLVACAPWTGAQRWVGALALVLPPGVAALAALASGHVPVAVLVGALAALLGRLLAPWVPAEGVHLTARGVTVRHHGRPQQVDWDDVRRVRITMWMVIETAGGRRVRFTPRQLAVGFDHLYVALALCTQHPALRQGLGTSASLDPRRWGVDA